MVIRFFDAKLNFIGEIDDYISLIYHRKWNTFSTFEIHIKEFYLDLFRKGHIITIGNNASQNGMIEYIETNDKEIVLKGYSLLFLLSNRITLPPTGQEVHAFHDVTENIIIALVTSNAILSPDSNRNFKNLMVSNNLHRGTQTTFQTRFKNLGVEITDLCKIDGLGCNIKLDYNTKKFVFEVLDGRNLSVGQPEVSPIIFSQDFDNILEQTYTVSRIDYKNCAYVGGQGEGADRQIAIVNSTLSDINRREIFVDARDIPLEGTATLEDRGKSKLLDTPEIENFELKIDTQAYKIEWDLGDIVTVLSKKYNIKLNVRISEVIETYENGTITIEPVFGERIKTITDKITSLEIKSTS